MFSKHFSNERINYSFLKIRHLHNNVLEFRDLVCIKCEEAWYQCMKRIHTGQASEGGIFAIEYFYLTTDKYHLLKGIENT